MLVGTGASEANKNKYGTGDNSIQTDAAASVRVIAEKRAVAGFRRTILAGEGNPPDGL